MRIARLLSTCAAAAAIGGVAVLAVAMGAAAPNDAATVADPTPTVSYSIPLMLSATPGTSAAVSISTTPSASLDPSASALVTSSSAAPQPSTSAGTSHSAPTTSSAPTSHAVPARHTVNTSPAVSPHSTAPVKGVALPLGYSTGTATHVVTVVASSHSSTVATLQAWTKAPGGGWLKWGSALTAHVGSQGLTTSPSESKSATPIGSFTLTQAFGHNANPGTSLPYRQTTPADWWISQAGPLYNTEQHCSSGCGFTLGSPNEHLFYETPYYNYAVVIDANRFPVHQGAGSAFFLHVTDGHATAGCVAIPQANLVTLMKWFLTSATHPRILIGVA